MRLVIATLLLLITANCALAQQTDAALISALLKQLDSAQYKQNTGEFHAGTFKSYRSFAGSPHNYQPDNNIFFTAITAFGIRNLIPHLTGADKITATNIYKRASTSYPLYKNKHGNPYYGFWGTKDAFMPHTYFVQYLKKLVGHSEDADDTVMILMTSDTDDSTATIVKKRMVALSNITGGRHIVSTYKRYSGIPAYSTWLGGSMTPDFDFAVHCNIMYFMLEGGQPLVTQDSATLQVITEMVKNRDYIKNPVFLSPYYVKSSILLYHLARLMGRFTIPQLEVYKPQLIADIQTLMAGSYNVIDQLILRTSLLRLGAPAPALNLHSLQEFEESNQQSFVFFQARAAFAQPVHVKEIFLRWSYLYYYFYCPDYNKFLWLEYLVEKKKHEAS